MALKIWLVVGDSNTSVSIGRRSRLPEPGNQNISNAAWREGYHVRRSETAIGQEEMTLAWTEQWTERKSERSVLLLGWK